MEMISFGSADIDTKISQMSGDEIDCLVFGAIQLDGKGTILAYNSTEGEITGRDQKAVLGQNFFTDVAPCTNQRGFRDRFDDGVRNNNLNTLVEWTFDHQMAPTKVQVHMKKAAVPDRYWMFVKRL
ncbi:MAG: photoactive yellow protein [Rhodothalassiaceae bacterium]